MNADDRGPAGEAKPPFPPVSGDAPVRREALTPPSGSVPQRTAFRSVTGTVPTTARPGTPPQPSVQGAARPNTYAPPVNQGSQGAPRTAPRVPSPEQTQRPAASSAPAGFTPARQHAPATGAPATGAPRPPVQSGFQPTGAPAAGASAAAAQSGFAPTTSIPGTVAATTGAAVTGATAGATAGSFGIGRLKNAATERVKANDAKAPVPGAPRKVRVLLSRVDPWSALKIGFLVAIAIGIMTVVAAHILWMTLNQMEAFVTIQEWVTKLFGGGQEVNILQFFDYSKDMSAVLLVSVVNVVLISGLSVIGAFIYNIISRVVGGVYMTLTDD